MPPRKKAASAAVDGTDVKTAPTRASTRARAPSAKAVQVAAVAAGTDAPKAAAPKKTAAKAKAATNGKAKGRGKRAREESDEEDAGDEDDVEEEDEEEEVVKKPAAKKAKTAKGAAAAKTAKGKGKKTKHADADADMDGDDAQDDAKADDDDEDDRQVAGQKKPASKKAGKAKDVADLPQKMVTILKRGAAPVDEHSGKIDTHQVLVTPEGVWDAMLNQTEIGKNANKYYVLQLLHPIGNQNDCVLFTRWGRVGEPGRTQVKGPWGSSRAVEEFKKQFRSKTLTDWERRVGMVQKKDKYVWLERSYDDEDDEKDDAKASSSQKEEEKIPDSTLAPEIQLLCRLIFNASMIDAHLSSMNYDANKLPLGKLAKSTILNGFAALKALSEVIGQPTGDVAQSHGGFRKAAEGLTSRYYSIIPHVFGRGRPVVIDNLERLKKELDLVDALGNMEVASKLIASATPRDASGNVVNPLDAHFASLALTKMDPVARGSTEFGALERYTRETHGATHRHYGVEVLQAFRVEREFETKAWNERGFGSAKDGERLLLWHGSRTTNFAGILQQGLRIAPPEAPVTGYMFGKGVYFADMMSKSANYCHAYLSDNTGLLLLCEVVAKPFYEQYDANYSADQDCKKARALSTKGLGRTQPAEWQDAGAALDHPELRGCHMPKGPGKDVADPRLCLQYNEYIVYDASQIRLRYLLMVKMQ
ncbi:poly polymerase catalytic domain-containing protein [Daedaleopsis nitida]|nr:poly polymerase catalytic domain-containing protein [Daedaleopsis nitida]